MSTITKKVYLYLYRQEFNLEKDNEYRFYKNHKIRYILAPYKLIPGNPYEDARKRGISFDEWYDTNWHPMFTNLDEKDCRIIEETECSGWNGLYNMLPILNHSMCAELVITAQYEVDRRIEDPADDESDISSEELLGGINYMAKYECNVVKRSSDDVMLGWLDDEPFTEENEDGYVEKWDVGDRTNATLVFYEPICNLFEYGFYLGDDDYEPYKATITIEGNIKRLC